MLVSPSLPVYVKQVSNPPSPSSPWFALKPFFLYLKLDLLLLCIHHRELTPQKHQHHVFLFLFLLERWKEAFAVEQTTCLFSLNPGCPLSVTLLPTSCRILLPLLLSKAWVYSAPPAFLREGRVLRLGSLSASLDFWGIQFSSFCWLVVACSLSLHTCPA